MSPKPGSFKQVETCTTCEHVFIKMDIEDTDEFYCHFDKSKRPICGNFQMDEGFRFQKDGETISEHIMERRRENSIWDAWADVRRVPTDGWCKKYKRKKLSDE